MAKMGGSCMQCLSLTSYIGSFAIYQHRRRELGMTYVNALVTRIPVGKSWWENHQEICCDDGCDPTCSACAPLTNEIAQAKGITP